jgi:hypothetical protein
MSQFDFKNLDTLIDQQDHLRSETRVLKQQQSQIEQQAIKWFIDNNIQFIDQSGCGMGPFWGLEAKVSEGTLSKDMLPDFFGNLLVTINNELQSKGNINALTPQICIKLVHDYTKGRGKRQIKLVKLKKASIHRNTSELVAWVNGTL